MAVHSAPNDDPLDAWFNVTTSAEARALETAIREILVPGGGDLHDESALENVSPLAAVYYVALFHAVRQEIRGFVASNPTWVKTASSDSRLALDQGVIAAGFRSACARLAEQLRLERPSAAPVRSEARLGSSTSIPEEPASIHAIVTSPPYCTRIDYVMATRPELAVLGFSANEVARLRGLMVGTPTMTTTGHHPTPFGPTTRDYLSKVAAHPSRASGTYYLRYYQQYFSAMSASLQEARRVLKPGGEAFVVLQDSYYKDVHLDIATIVKELAASHDLHELDSHSFVVSATKASIHRPSHRYRTEFSARETIIRLQ
jgi:hypothetical protein